MKCCLERYQAPDSARWYPFLHEGLAHNLLHMLRSHSQQHLHHERQLPISCPVNSQRREPTCQPILDRRSSRGKKQVGPSHLRPSQQPQRPSLSLLHTCRSCPHVCKSEWANVIIHRDSYPTSLPTELLKGIQIYLPLVDLISCQDSCRGSGTRLNIAILNTSKRY